VSTDAGSDHGPLYRRNAWLITTVAHEMRLRNSICRYSTNPVARVTQAMPGRAWSAIRRYLNGMAQDGHLSTVGLGVGELLIPLILRNRKPGL
jgi:hypothetical protein